ncbi:MAG: FAD-dependent oxidoreductase [Deltaproteobacteria bacterium]|nr:FAD-dependent oxidoreductase [Deltaproteobacteria bacterium]NIS77540.1 FAD-dependent oxidoreductase [Deltaproteobacteria bacterium]
MICGGTGCIAGGAFGIKNALEKEIAAQGLGGEVAVVATGCNGFCGQGPLMVVQPDEIFYGFLKPEDIPFLVQEHFLKGRPVERLMFVPPEEKEPVPLLSDIPFFSKQVLVVLRNKGIIDPEKIDDYIARDGYAALEKVLSGVDPPHVVEEIIRSGLRGRGGAGFPAGLKWKTCMEEGKHPKFVIANCDEGDPGAYMDRSILESDPHSVLEGMILAAYGIGAAKGYIYVRTEYPLAISRMRKAISQAEDYGLVGENILGTGFSFSIEIREGSGAFVCGEETSLIHSIEGETPEPRQRPPFPAKEGIWECPTVINNVETLANVPVIIHRGADWFKTIGTDLSRGTKIFSLVGKVNNTGLIEVPMGITLREIVYDIGGGIPDNNKLKAVQTGGPSGGCIPSSSVDLPIDYESLKNVGSMMGSGGMIVVDEDTCMVDFAKYFIQFTNDESCGKCTTCRDGSEALLEILTRISEGEGQEGDIEFLEELSKVIKDASMCGLGATLPNPVLSTLQYFREEYEEHIKYKRCPAVVCRGIISSPCQYMCPLKTDVPAYLGLIAKGEFEEALEVVRMTNPLPTICGRVCWAHCELRCRAKETGDAIAVKNLKRFLSDREIRSGVALKAPPFPGKKFDEKIAIVGSGPAGLTAGYYLAQKGYEVKIYEKLPVAGGMLATGIPDYRLPKDLLQMDIKSIEEAGVCIETNSPVENVDALMDKGYKAALVAVGAHENRKLGIPGEDAEGVRDPIAFLRSVNLEEEVSSIGEKVGIVGIVGGGNTAFDVARTAQRLGAKEVFILYRRTREEMPAIEEEIEAALEEGIKIEYLAAPTKIIKEEGKVKAVELIRMKLGEPDASGRRRPVPIEGSEFILELDSLIPAISQDPDLSLIPEEHVIKISRENTIEVHGETFMTDKEGIFACGDAVTGPSDVTTVMASAKIAAESIHKYLRGEEVKREYEPVSPSVVVEPIRIEEEMVRVSRVEMPKLMVEQRSGSFQEVEIGYSKDMAVEEARRCLRCDWDVRRLLKGGKEERESEQDAMRIQGSRH